LYQPTEIGGYNMAAKKLNRNLYQDFKSGIWYFQKDVKGKAYKFSLGTTSLVEARRRRDEYLRDIQLKGFVSFKEEPSQAKDAPFFGEVVKQWADIKKMQISPTTFRVYRKNMNKYVLPVFGNKRIDAITSLEIESFLSRINGSGIYKQTIMTPFKNIMNFATKHRIISDNPMNLVDRIKSEKAEVHPLDLEEIRIFLEHVEPFYRQLFIFLFFTGVRIGEAAGLKWKRVDIKNRKVRICKTIVFCDGKPLYKSPKTHGSVRDIKLSASVVNALLEQQKRTWKGDGENFVFMSKRGRHINRHALNDTVFKPTLLKAGLPTNRSLKDTRASFITNSLDHNERLSFIQRQVGHNSTRMIIDHYYNYVPSADDGKKLESAWEIDQDLTRHQES
jgi:integrase